MDAPVTDSSINGLHVARTSRLFALLIGINTYNSKASNMPMINPGFRGSMAARPTNPNNEPIFDNLGGAVADAEEFHKYLVDTLNVPEHHITLLRDQDATRQRIIKALQDLSTNQNIKEGDSVFIFYAGHGAQALPPKRLMNDRGCPEQVELLIPYDYHRDPSNSQNMGIPDYTLAALLNNIAKEKGNNITVVFDCCHSASALRGVKQTTIEEEVLVRSGPELNYHVPDDLDEDIWGLKKRGLTVPPALKHMGTRSYVFFAACTSSEKAKEKANRGYFTTALLGYLKANPQSALKLSCSRVASELNIEGQNPQCEGFYSKTRPIFHNFTPLYGKLYFDFCEEPKSKNASRPTIILNAGEAHGLTVGDELVVFSSKLPSDENQPIATIVLKEVSINKSSFQFITDTHITLSDYPQAAAVLYRPAITGDESQYLAVYVDPRDLELAKRVRDIGGSVLVKTMDRAHIHLSSTTDKQLCFQVVDAELLGVQLKPHFTPDTEADLTHALTGLSHYYRHLKRNSTSLSTDNIFVSLFRVKDNGHGHPRVVKAHGADNLISKDIKTANIVVSDDDEAIYGLEITNGGEQEKLYPVLLYFDNVDFTITRSFPHVATLGGQTDSSWPLKGKSMTIGYGVGAGSGVHPFSFYLANENDVEAGFFKLFIFETPVDLQNVERDTPLFVKTRGCKPHVLPDIGSSTSRWGTITFSVIQRRGGLAVK